MPSTDPVEGIFFVAGRKGNLYWAGGGDDRARLNGECMG
jgi:hypothetical protein